VRNYTVEKSTVKRTKFVGVAFRRLLFVPATNPAGELLLKGSPLDVTSDLLNSKGTDNLFSN